MKVLVVLLTVAAAAAGAAKLRAHRDEADLWHEATTPPEPGTSELGTPGSARAHPDGPQPPHPGT